MPGTSADARTQADAVYVQRLDLGGGGLTVAVKDSIDIAGHPTRAGSAAFAAAPAALRHAAVVEALLAAGCHIVGKTNMHELAYGVTGINRFTGTPVNPRHPRRIPGGSSSGSAVAVAAGDVDFAVGTDTGGSIRIPAACCGIFGLKTTYGRISRAGAHPAVSSLDCIGPFAGSAAMLEHAMAAMDPTFTAAAAPSAVRLGFVNVAAHASVLAAAHGALAHAGVSATPVELPSFEATYGAGLTIIGAENWQAYGHLAGRAALGEDVRARLLASRDISREALAAAERIRTRFRAEVDAALEQVDALVLPTLPEVPPTLEATTDSRAVLSLTALVRPFNVSGHPALTMPLETAEQLPAGLQLVGRRGADAALCALARRLSP